MSDLLTQKQETFCLNLFKDMSQREAYKQAGYSVNCLASTMDRIAFDLANNPKIVARLKELRQSDEDAARATVEEIERTMTLALRATPEDVMELSEDGRDLVIKKEALKSLAVSHIKTEQIALGKMPVRITRLSLVDKVRAADLLCKIKGAYEVTPPVVQDNRQYNIYIQSDEAKKKLERLLAGEKPLLIEGSDASK